MLFINLTEARKRLEELYALIADPKVISDSNRLKAVARENNLVEKIVGEWTQLDEIAVAIQEALQIIKEGDDPELIELAKAEISEKEELQEQLQNSLNNLLIPEDPDDSRNTIMEIRAGTGGEEASLFAADLFRMYSKYSEKEGWKVELMSSSSSDRGGFKEIIFLITGENVYGRLRYESGVHRVQRVPETETQGRLHTSAASVVVLPEAEEVDVNLDPDELRIDVFRSSGPGGQSVNTTDSAVRITHIPTGLVVSCQDEKSQHKNKAKALKILRSRLLERVREEQAAEEAAERRDMVAGGDRSAKIRTYNFPQNRVTDHRIKLTLYNLQEIVDGDLGEVIDAVNLAARGSKELVMVRSTE